MMRGLVLFVLLAMMPGFAVAQDKAQTLADIRTELAALNAEFTALKQELVTTGAAGSGAAGGDALQRMDAIEAALVQLTSKTEAVELRLNKVAADGTNRIGDLEFRLCEVTEGCDIGSLGTTQPLGGAGTAPAVVGTDPGAAPATGGAELAVGEQADFDRAKEVLGTGDFRTAADLFATFTTTYTGGPLSQEAQFLRGEALAQLGETSNAARAYLEAFSDAPDGPRAGEALLKLGQSLGTLGQTPEACVTLTEVGARFPGSVDATNAQIAMQGLGCQ
jgi:tol-pal system protein YbgF